MNVKTRTKKRASTNGNGRVNGNGNGNGHRPANGNGRANGKERVNVKTRTKGRASTNGNGRVNGNGNGHQRANGNGRATANGRANGNGHGSANGNGHGRANGNGIAVSTVKDARRVATELGNALLVATSVETARHSDDVEVISSAICESLGVPERQRDDVQAAARLHDIGKASVPGHILQKTGPLDADEWELMREHTVVGEQILVSVPELREIARLVRHSHERWDGGGYPDGLAGEDIPLGSRIIFCADSFHAVRSDRPYREGRSAAKALAEIKRCTGTQFDPKVVKALEEVVLELKIVSPARRTPRSSRLTALLLCLALGGGGSALARTNILGSSGPAGGGSDTPGVVVNPFACTSLDCGSMFGETLREQLAALGLEIPSLNGALGSGLGSAGTIGSANAGVPGRKGAGQAASGGDVSAGPGSGDRVPGDSFTPAAPGGSGQDSQGTNGGQDSTGDDGSGGSQHSNQGHGGGSGSSGSGSGGNSGNAPGHTGSSGSPGNSGNAPGHTGASPGNSGGGGSGGGQGGGNQGQGGSDAPGTGNGNANSGSYAGGGSPGNSGNAPGHTDTPPAPGNSGNAPGHNH